MTSQSQSAPTAPAKASSIYRDYWTREQLATLRKLAPTHTAKEIARIIGRDSYVGVHTKASQLKIKLPGRRWTVAEDKILLEMKRLSYSAIEIADALRRTTAAIYQRWSSWNENHNQ